MTVVERDVSLFISVNSCRDWKAPFAMALTSLLNNLHAHKLGGRLKHVDIRAGSGSSLLPSGREAAFKIACDEKFTHWLPLDDDMEFPADTVEQLLARDKDVVCANYSRKMTGKPIGTCLALDGKILDSTDKTGCEPILAMAMGCVLIKMERVRPIPAPHFEVIWNANCNDYWGEDYYFSNSLGKNGIEIFCDHDLSQKVYHWGEAVYGWPQKTPDAEIKVAT